MESRYALIQNIVNNGEKLFLRELSNKWNSEIVWIRVRVIKVSKQSLIYLINIDCI